MNSNNASRRLTVIRLYEQTISAWELIDVVSMVLDSLVVYFS